MTSIFDDDDVILKMFSCFLVLRVAGRVSVTLSRKNQMFPDCSKFFIVLFSSNHGCYMKINKHINLYITDK